MNNKKYSIQASTIEANENGLLKLLQDTGKVHFLREIQDSIHVLEIDEQGRVPLELVTDNIQTISNIVDEANLGLKIVSIIDLKNLPLYATIKHSTDILFSERQSIPLPVLLNLVVRYFSVITEVVSVSIDQYEDRICINLSPSLPDVISLHQMEGVAVGIYRLLKAFSSIRLVGVELSHPQPLDSDDTYLSCLGLIPLFSQTENIMTFSTDNTPGEMEEKTITLFSSVQNLMNSQFPNESFHERCRHVLKCILGFGEPKREHVANILNMSISSLQRRLKQDGFSFQQILLNTRKELSFEFLVQQKRSATDVAVLLGYQSASQFFKAFKLWFNMTPLQYQKNEGEMSLS